MNIHDNHPVLYIIRCLANSKVYVGSTETRTDRFRTHRNKFKAGNGINQEMQADWDLYGLEQFEFIVLEWFREGIDPTRLKTLESEACVTYDAYNPEKGYNTNDPLTGKRMRPSQTRGGKKLYVLSSVDNSILHEFNGIGECLKGLPELKEKYIARAVTYWPRKEENNIRLSKSYRGYIFVYEEDYNSEFDYAGYQKPRQKREPKPKALKTPKERPINIPSNRKQILLKNIETGEEIICDSIKGACTKFGLMRNKVRKCVDNEFGKYHTHGFHIRYTGAELKGYSIYSDGIVYRD